MIMGETVPPGDGGRGSAGAARAGAASAGAASAGGADKPSQSSAATDAISVERRVRTCVSFRCGRRASGVGERRARRRR
ncbi:hypothetical protein ETD83_40525 [Actinomadura soli]|uniref:Uncharacterized protein n=1 Tax=Actinomadura soli TaxID=2508997 RepID=A0A5C4IYG8_9ACTN|nr:hypothetical protein ETD83_40525 [Actinomadura soli]